MKRSVYLEGEYLEFNPQSDLIKSMRQRKIIPDNVPDNEIYMTIWGAGSWQIHWCKGEVLYTYNPWTALITEADVWNECHKTNKQYMFTTDGPTF